jgi:hypothetical protein
LQAIAGAAKAPHCSETCDMIAIAAIALFLVAFGVLNYLDFGRLD